MRLNALVIDDSKIMRKMVMHALQGSGMAEFTFVEAEDGAEALAKFSPGGTDIVFADWNMPNMSGIEFVDKVRAMKRTAHLPIIMVTSEKTMGKMEQALDKSGAHAYICKPFTAEDLQRKLARLIDELEQRRAAEKPAGFFSRRVGA